MKTIGKTRGPNAGLARMILLTVAMVVAAKGSVLAEGSQVPEIPAAFSEASKEKLSPQHNNLTREEAQLRRDFAEMNEKCSGIVEGSTEEKDCRATRERLNAAARQLAERISAFRENIRKIRDAELKDLAQQESALSKEIKAALDEMRSLTDQASEASMTKMESLNEKLKNLIGRRLKVRDNFTMVAGTRG